MCGIAGFVGHAHDESHLRRAAGALHHRGPDGKGAYVDAASRVGLGHARLSIIDLQCGAQPLFSEDGNLALVCNGEIYDFERIRTELEAQGHHFATHSDSEVILHLYEQHGMDFMTHLRGEFAFLLYDKTRQLLLAVRDRFGIKPLFFHKDGPNYLFGSEAKAIFAMGPVRPKIDVTGIRDFFSLVAPDSIFEGVQVVYPGCLMKVDLAAGTHETIQYWDLDLQPEKCTPLLDRIEDALPIVREAVEEAVRLRLRADVPVGVYLSGGIDSAIVAATVSRLFAGKLKVFTVSFPEEDLYNEYQLAKNMAEHINADFHSVRCDHKALLDHTEGSLWMNELPFFNFHGVGKYMLSELAREHVTVVLTGEGSDEVFLGYAVFSGAAMTTNAEDDKPPRPGTIARRLYDGLGYVPARGLRILFSGPMQAFGRLFFHPNHRQRLRDANPFDLFKRRLDRRQLEDLPDVRRRQYMWIKVMLPQYILTMLGDRSELAHAIEGRTPFLDHHLFEKARRVADHLKIHNGVEKYILREAFKNDITQEIYARKKWPYTAPPLWIRKGDHAKLDELIDKHLSKEAMEESGIFSYRTLKICQCITKMVFFDCMPKRTVNSFIMYMLTVQMLDRAYVRDFDKNLQERLPA